MIERLKSPVVWIQVISIIVGGIIFFIPSIEEQVRVVAGIIIALINVFAGLNDPTDRENF